ncbi:MAG: hypothetical protein RIT81_16415 [Deltaproteobacteria bacterium]
MRWWFEDAATWTYALHPESDATFRDGASRAEWLADVVARIAAAIPPFAVLISLDVSSDSAGEYVVDVSGDRADVAIDYVRSDASVWNVHYDLGLCCEVDRDGAWEAVELRAARITLFVALDENGVDEKLIEKREAVAIIFTLNTDLFSATRLGSTPDNERVATHNAPRLAAFLRRLEDDVGARFLSVESQSYREMNRYGFGRLPPNDKK